MKIDCAHDELVELHKLIPHPRNANKHPDRQIELLAKIIDYQGQRSPIVVSKRSGFITKGHGRLLALQKLGWDKCAVDYQDYESEAQEFADLVADNKIAELAEHDDNLMIEGIKDLGLEDFELLGLDDFKVELGELPDLSSEKPEMEQITFTLHNTQAEVVREALSKAQESVIDLTLNENKNGAAIYAICANYLMT